MAELTIDTLMDALVQWRETLPGDTPIAHSMDDEGEFAEPIGEIGPGFLVPAYTLEGVCANDARLWRVVSDDDVDEEPDARRVLVLWPYLPEVRHA
jgi:hypothetical protein